ncbi:helix-turn-helix transcriptional regulator [Dysgonomonas sp. 25]|uniref:helix-turn-helix domain-containing protein n=1 Tax=Dysgonomonas sp. 25 TaxID=2302933 RepID=UPI0013D2FD67|nr:helix-turn-helix transcriptional regulator [Dysgonomonas sp. 25]NDV68583.1 XRE family transcriptional regulator [Dysgonomonas sp. 25]
MSEIVEKPINKKTHQGRLLRAMRSYKGRTQSQVAKDNNMTQSRIYELEISETISDEILQQFANYYEVPVEFLKEFDLEEAAKNFTYNNSATLSDNAMMNAPQADSLNIINPDSSKDLKEAYDKLSQANLKIGKLEATVDYQKKDIDALKEQLKNTQK